MRSIIFRLLAGIVGLGIVAVLLAVPAIRHAPNGFWPDWIYLVSFIVTAAVFLIFALTGRAWPRAYGEKIFRKDNKLNDR